MSSSVSAPGQLRNPSPPDEVHFFNEKKKHTKKQANKNKNKSFGIYRSERTIDETNEPPASLTCKDNDKTTRFRKSTRSFLTPSSTAINANRNSNRPIYLHRYKTFSETRHLETTHRPKRSILSFVCSFRRRSLSSALSPLINSYIPMYAIGPERRRAATRHVQAMRLSIDRSTGDRGIEME
jgi:hypothetical protein